MGVSEFRDYRTRKQKTVVDQDRWDGEMPDLVEAFLDYRYRQNSGRLYEGIVREKHIILVWSSYGMCLPFLYKVMLMF